MALLPRQIAGTNLPTPREWIAWLAGARTWLSESHYTIKSKGLSGNLTQVEGHKTPLDTNEPTAPYIIGRELNLRKLPGRQWESNSQPSEQLRPIPIKTSASTETATVAYVLVCDISWDQFSMSLVSKLLLRRSLQQIPYQQDPWQMAPLLCKFLISKELLRISRSLLCMQLCKANTFAIPGWWNVFVSSDWWQASVVSGWCQVFVFPI